MKKAPSTPLVWFGVLGGALAWVTQFTINLAFSFAQCNNPGGRWQLPVHGWQIATSVPALLIGMAATGVSVWMLKASSVDNVSQQEREGEGSTPPAGRVNFLGWIGITVNFLAMAIVVMTAIGGPLLPVCQQS